MFSNLYCLSKSFRFSIAIIIWNILSYTISRKIFDIQKTFQLMFLWQKLIISRRLNTIKKNQKKEQSTYSKSRIWYSFFDEIKKKMNDSNFFWNIFQFRSLRIRFFKIVNFFWYSFIASFRILSIDCKFEYVFFIVFFNVCVSTRSNVEMICDCSFSKKKFQRHEKISSKNWCNKKLNI